MRILTSSTGQSSALAQNHEKLEGTQDIPIVDAIRVRGRYGDLLELVGCYYCGRRHIHGAGEHGTAFGSFDGSRVPHCTDRRNWDSQYYVREISPAEAVA